MHAINAWFTRAGLPAALLIVLGSATEAPARADPIGEERSVYERLEDGDERSQPLKEVLRRGQLAFEAQWTPAADR